MTAPLEAACHDCGLPYADPGFCDLVVPNDIWARISPSGDEGGLLCPTCICGRLSNAGITCSAFFGSGPIELVPYQANSQRAARREQAPCAECRALVKAQHIEALGELKFTQMKITKAEGVSLCIDTLRAQP